MKCSLIGPTFPYRGGIAQHTTRLYQALREKHTVDLISFRRQYPRWLFPGRSDQDPSQRNDSFPVERLLDPINPFTWFSTAAHIGACHSEALIMPWWESYWALPVATIARLVRRSGARVVYVCHNLEPHERRLGAGFLTHLALSQGDGFVVQSTNDVSRLEKILPRARVSYVPHPIYSAAGAAAKLVRKPDEIAELLFFGFVRPYKGLKVLMNALPMVLKRLPVHLTVAGEFWESREQYEREIRELEIQDSVTLIDRYVPDEELAALFNRTDLVVLPYVSVTTSAALGLAIGNGVPVVVSDIGDLGKIVRENAVGAVAECGNPSALASAIIDALEPSRLDSFRRNVDAMRQSADDGWATLVHAIEELAAQ